MCPPPITDRAAGRGDPGATARRLLEASDDAARIALAAERILESFDAYYVESRAIPAIAQEAFERRDPGTSLRLSIRRLSMYSESIEALGQEISAVCAQIASRESLWRQVEAHYWPLIEDRYEADLAYAYIHSVRRIIFQGEWRPVDYSFRDPAALPSDLHKEVYVAFPGVGAMDVTTARSILCIPRFECPFADLDTDAARVAARVNADLGVHDEAASAIDGIEMINAGFFRNRGGYVVGRILPRQGAPVPLIVALLNSDDGIYVDAVITSEADAHNLFSSTLANFHVANTRYHELAAFLHTVMPRRPLGLHYSTIGFNHVGKVAVMNELRRELAGTGERLATSVGFRGTVAIGFASPSSAYNLKVIRDHPTEDYKWGEFEGIDSVLAKYKRVHEINRTGSMLDNIIYYNLKLERAWFDPDLLEELASEASQAVSIRGESVVLKYLIVQRRMIPLPVFLEHASEDEAETAIVNLGHCIKNNAAANIFNKDLDARNYGVGGYLKVYLYDYDALEPFTDVKIRSNADRTDGEEDVPDWYFEDGTVFLPEEVEVGLRIPNRRLRRLFRSVHGDLLTTEYWLGVQSALKQGQVPAIRAYPQECEIALDGVVVA